MLISDICSRLGDQIKVIADVFCSLKVRSTQRMTITKRSATSAKGRLKIGAKVIDIFDNDTTKVVEVSP